MTDYEKRLAALGVDRGALAKRFGPDYENPAVGHEPKLVNPKAGFRIARPEPGEDLTHLNPERTRFSQESGRKGAKVMLRNRKVIKPKLKNSEKDCEVRG